MHEEAGRDEVRADEADDAREAHGTERRMRAKKKCLMDHHQQHEAARRAKKDLAQVWAALPEERDFAPLALGITEEAIFGRRRRAAARAQVAGALPAESEPEEPLLPAEEDDVALEGASAAAAAADDGENES